MARKLAENRNNSNAETAQNTPKKTALHDKLSVDRYYNDAVRDSIKKLKAVDEGGKNLFEAAGGVTTTQHADSLDLKAMVASIMTSTSFMASRFKAHGSLAAITTFSTVPAESLAVAPTSSGAADNSDDLGNETDSDESDYAYSDFGDESDGSYEEDTDAEDDVEPTAAFRKKRELLEKQEEARLGQKLVDLYKNAVQRTSSLSVFAESCLDMEERFREEAEKLQIPIAKIAILRDVLTHAMYLHEYLALQPSSPLMEDFASWLNDNTIHNMVNLTTRDDFVEGSEFLDPTIVGLVLPLAASPAQTLIQLNNYIDNKTTAPFHLKESTTRVVAVLAFPQHWTMFGIDSNTGTITFVDSLPHQARRQYAREVLPRFAELCNSMRGWKVTK